jgi:thiol-disulfide isomerase/thioredoxin
MKFLRTITCFLFILLNTHVRAQNGIPGKNDNTSGPEESIFFKTGTALKPFKAKDIDGIKYNINDLKGKIVIINFWFIGCKPCEAEIPKLNQLADAYQNSPSVIFLAVALDDKYTILNFVRKTPFHYHIIPNGRRITVGNYGITHYPTHVVIDKDGIVRFHATGNTSDMESRMKKTIDTILSE